jgi:hypothetical protein
MEVFKKAIGYQPPPPNAFEGFDGSYPTRRTSFTQGAAPIDPQIWPRIPHGSTTAGTDKWKNKKLELKNLAGNWPINKQNTLNSGQTASEVVRQINLQKQNNDNFSENCGAYDLDDEEENSLHISAAEAIMGIKNEAAGNRNDGLYEANNAAKNPVKAAFKLGTKNVFNHFRCRFLNGGRKYL